MSGYKIAFAASPKDPSKGGVALTNEISDGQLVAIKAIIYPNGQPMRQGGMFKVHLTSRKSSNLDVVTKVLIYENRDQLRAEAIAEHAEQDHLQLVSAIRKVHGSVIVNSSVTYEA